MLLLTLKDKTTVKMQQLTEVMFASGALGYKDCFRASMTCKITYNMFKKWENFIVNNDKEDYVAKYVTSSPKKHVVVKDIYCHPEKLFTVYNEVLMSVPREEQDYLIYLLFNKNIHVADQIIELLILTKRTSTQQYITFTTMFIKILEYHLIIANCALSTETAWRYLRVVDATYFVIEQDILPPATSTVILILKAYIKSQEQVHIGPNGGIYHVIGGKKKYIKSTR